MQRNVLNESMDGESTSPVVIRAAIIGSFSSRQFPASRTDHEGAVDEGIETPDEKFSERSPDGTQDFRELLAVGKSKGCGIHCHQGRESTWVTARHSKTDRSTPVMRHQHRVGCDFQMVKEALQVIDSIGQSISVLIFIGEI